MSKRKHQHIEEVTASKASKSREKNQEEEKGEEEKEDYNNAIEGESDSDDWSFGSEESEDEEEGEEEEKGKGESASKWKVVNEDDNQEENDDFASNKLEIALDPKTKKTLDSKISKLNKTKDQKEVKKPELDRRGVLYLGRIPHGFYETQMKSFFNQFGKVTRLRLSRSKKTGNSKHYAFIEFEYDEVAKIVAETMHNYLMFGRILKCYVLPEEKIHPDMFKGSQRKFLATNWKKIEQQRRTKAQTPEKTLKRLNALRNKDNKKREKLKSLGIDYDFPGYAAVLPKPSKHQRFND